MEQQLNPLAIIEIVFISSFSAAAACFRGRQLQYCFPGLPSLPADTTGKLVTSYSTFQKAKQLFFFIFLKKR